MTIFGEFVPWGTLATIGGISISIVGLVALMVWGAMDE